MERTNYTSANISIKNLKILIMKAFFTSFMSSVGREPEHNSLLLIGLLTKACKEECCPNAS